MNEDDEYERGLACMVYKLFNKKLQLVALNLCLKMNNWLKNFINPLLENSKKEKNIEHSKTIFWVLILQICS